jgi:hypothetical protein
MIYKALYDAYSSVAVLLLIEYYRSEERKLRHYNNITYIVLHLKDIFITRLKYKYTLNGLQRLRLHALLIVISIDNIIIGVF